MSIVAQAGIICFGASAVYLTQDVRPERRRWACICGMLGQPFWFMSAWEASQWGVFAISAFYTYSWGRGIWNFWIKK